MLLCEPPLLLQDRLARYVGELTACCPGIASVWSMGDRADGRRPEASGIWELVAFADETSLRRLRAQKQVHRMDVLLRIVTDGDRFEVAWGLRAHGSLDQWGWVQTGPAEAFYSEASWQEPARDGIVQRTRRRAVCLWRTEAAVSPAKMYS